MAWRATSSTGFADAHPALNSNIGNIRMRISKLHLYYDS
jgi:hypothetical protein